MLNSLPFWRLLAGLVLVRRRSASVGFVYVTMFSGYNSLPTRSTRYGLIHNRLTPTCWPGSRIHPGL